MKRKPYKIIIIPASICIAAVSFLSFYITGVIDRSAAFSLLEERLNAVCKAIDDRTVSLEKINQEIKESFCVRARAISILMSKNSGIFNDETLFEEMRVAVGADVISVTDSTGTIIYSTDMSVEKTSALDDFKVAVNNKVFSEAVIYSSDNDMRIVTGTSRLDSPGIIQIQFALKDYQQQIEREGFSSVVSEMPVMKHGHLAVIDAETNTYISHTDNYLNGGAVQFPSDSFSKDEGIFSTDYDGKNVLVKYKKHNDKTAMGLLPYSEIYQRRNAVVKWVLFSTIVVTFIIILALRNYILRRKI